MEEKVVFKRPPRSPALAGILAFFFPGTGALYNRQIAKGLIFMIVIAGLISTLAQGPQLFVILLASLLLAGFYIYQIIDAIQTSKSINRRYLMGKEEEEVMAEELPEAVKTGSIFWGIVLMALGGILLLANFDVISYDFIWNFWPVVVIVIGVKILVDYFYKQRNES
jgi:TM2 domain-containing membrane protein YozV